MWPRAMWPEGLRAEASSSLGLPINYLQDETAHKSKLLFQMPLPLMRERESSLMLLRAKFSTNPGSMGATGNFIF